MGAFSVKIQIPEQGFAEFSPEAKLGPQADTMVDLAIRVFTDRFVQETVKNLTNKARDFAPKRTGNLKKSIKSKKGTDGWTMVAGAPYASFVEYGSGLYDLRGSPHYIYPKTAKFLVFRGKSGNLVFAKRIRGQKPRLYMNRAIQQLDWATEEAWNSMSSKGSIKVGADNV